MEKNISIIGGDLRIINLAKILANDGFHVHTYALEKSGNLFDFDKIIQYNTIQDAIQKSNYVISSIPLSKNNKNIFTPFSDFQISLDDLEKNLEGKTFIAGKINKKIKENSEIISIDIMDIEEYAVLNCIATAEGAIQIAMEEFPKTLSGSNILVMGFGRIGKILSKMLQGIGANVYCEARKNEDLAYIKAYGYSPIPLNNLEKNLDKFDIIMNTIPVQTLTKSRLDLVKNDALIIDLASNPGGVDFEYAKSKDIKTIWALALPGKVAPVSSAEYIKTTIYNILNN